MVCSFLQGSYSRLGGLAYVETLVIVTAEPCTIYTSMGHPSADAQICYTLASAGQLRGRMKKAIREYITVF
jgi:hypothetical protein